MPDEFGEPNGENHSSMQNLSRSFRFPDPCWRFFSSAQPTHFL